MKLQLPRPWSLITAMLIVAAIAGACTPVAPVPPTPQPTDVREIMNIVWQWTDLSETQPAASSTIAGPENYTITFLAQNQLNIKADCNAVGGIYAVAGDRLTIQLGPSTMAFCGEQSQDQIFLDLLTRVSSFALQGGALQLATTDDSIMGFANAGAPQAEVAGPPPFANALWEWEAFRSPERGKSFNVAEPEKYSALFLPDESLALRADCNRALGSYTVDGASLAINLGPATLAECGPGSLYSEYLGYLSNVASYVMEGSQLILNLKMDAGDMVFRRVQVIPGLEITPDQVSVDVQQLPYKWQSNLVAETPYDTSMPPGPVGMPEHIEVNFIPAAGSQSQSYNPVMYILPVNAYRAQWEQAGNDYVTQSIESIYRNTVALQSPPPTSGMPALPPEQVGGVNDVAAQIGRVTGVTADSASRDGYRFIGRWAQDANPIINGNLQYVYQGFTNDGKYLVSFWYPVTTAALPDSMSTFPEREQQRFDSDPQAYIEEQIAALNQLAPSDFEPNLETLDALVASLRIEEMPADGLTGYVWHPVAQSSGPGEALEAIANPKSYSVAYYPSGNLDFVADCNVGKGTYTVDGAVTGGIHTMLGPSTLAECGPDSWGQSLVDTLTAAQNFRVLPGGIRMQLLMPAAGPVITFVKAGPAEEILPIPQPTVVIPTPAPVVPTGRVTADPGVNVRSGPGTNYPIIGFANFGATGQVVGRSADGQWWATPLASSPTGLGWVSGAYVQVSGAEYVPVIVAPPPPMPPTAVPTATSLPPTATPTASPEVAFWADRYQINQGECARLSWRAVNVQAVWVYPQGQPYQNYPQAGEGSQVVCPQATTTYEMRVQMRNGSIVVQQVTIQVSAIPPATAVPTKIPPTATAVPTQIPPTATSVPTQVPPTATPVPTQPPAPDNPLANTSWVAERFEGFGVPLPDARPTIAFSADGQADVFGGCNSFIGTYTVNGNQIAIVIGAGTGMACSDAVLAQEASYLSLLTRARVYELPSGQLVLRDSGGAELLRFSRRDR